ncbi:MAG: hypothetical protein MJZ58_03690 [Paludibacteraceae bacterium]|nr:hypothetical protein [Paludibacteraceae bacterium]
MRKFVLFVFIVGCMPLLSAQTDSLWRDSTLEVCGEWEVRRIEPAKKMTFGAFLNNLTLPFELGCAYSPKAGQTNPGFYTRTGLEYRSYKTVGWCVAAEFDAYTRWYNEVEQSLTNISKGRDWTMDLLVGGGYRFPLVKNLKEYLKRPEYNNKWSLGFTLFAGASCLTLENVTPVEGKDTYNVNIIDTWVPSAKFTCSLEYSINYAISIYTTVGYLQHFIKTPIQKDLVGDLINTIGISFFFR